MEIGSLNEVCEQLKREIDGELESRPGKRWRCPVPLRSRIVSYARVCRERGEPLLDISNRLGLVESTLARWLRADRKALALAPGADADAKRTVFRSYADSVPRECGQQFEVMRTL